MSYPGPGEPQDPQEHQGPPAQPSPGFGERHGQPGQPGQPNQPGYSGQPGHHGQPGYQEQPGQPGYYGQPGRQAGFNVLAILSLVFAFVFAPAGIVFGHLARRQIQRTGEQGGRLATWGLILSYFFTALYLIACCGWLALVGWAGSEGDGGSY